MGFICKIFGKVSVCVLVFTLVPVIVIAVGSGRGDGAANFAELDSDFSEPGKHVLNIWYDRCFTCLRESLCVTYECRWIPRCLWGNYPVVPKSWWSLMRDGQIMWWHEGQQGGTVVACQPCVIRLSSTLTWLEPRYRSFPACSKIAMTSDERWPNHVVTWRAARWYCCSMPALCHPTFPTLTWLEPCYRPFPFPCYHMSHCQDTV